MSQVNLVILAGHAGCYFSTYMVLQNKDKHKMAVNLKEKQAF